MDPGASNRPILATELTKDAYQRLAAERTFVLPMGILEEHGPHLPLGTDTFQAEAVVREAAAQSGAVVLPTVNYGNCRSTRPFPGSISLSFDTVRTIVSEILCELARHGVSSVAVVSGHAGGGHMRAIRLGAQEALNQAPTLRVAVLSEWEILFGLHPDEIPGSHTVPTGDGHAGTAETARMLDLHPELVKRPPGEHVMPDEGFIVSATPEAGWPDGYAGDPSAATAELGRALHDAAVQALTELFEGLTPEPEKVL